MDSLEQRGRLMNLRIFGLSEDKDEDTNSVVVSFIKSNLKLNINDCDVVDAYRVGKYVASKIRPILVHFSTRDVRAKVYGAKKCLKGTPTVIREDLTKMRLQVIKEAIETYGPRNVWSLDGNIFARADNAIIKFPLK